MIQGLLNQLFKLVNMEKFVYTFQPISTHLRVLRTYFGSKMGHSWLISLRSEEEEKVQIPKSG
jgi:hypothetical protein